MSWFSDQIKERRETDEQLLEASFQQVAGVVLGRRMADRLVDERIVTKRAIDEILKYYHLKPVEVPASVKTADEQLDYCLRRYGLMRRTVELKDDWYTDAYGPMLGFMKESGQAVALLPGALYGYTCVDAADGRQIRLNKKNAELIKTEAICFYRPFPQREIGVSDLLGYMKQCIHLNDIAAVVLAVLAVTIAGLFVPKLIAALTGPVLAGGSAAVLIGAAICLFAVSLSSKLLNSLSEMLMKRLEIKTSMGVEAAMMIRMLSLPVSFFRQYSPGELKSRSMSVGQLCLLLQGMVFNTGLISLSSLLYVTQIFRYAPALVIPSLIIIGVTVIFTVTTTLAQVDISRRYMEQNAKESGLGYSMITGVQKLKLAGAEKRFFARWLSVYAEGAELVYDPPVFLKINSVISTGISLFSTVILYYLAMKSGISQSSFFAFTAAFGTVMGAFSALSGIAQSAANISPILEMAEPFLKTAPETTGNREIVTSISGRVELDHVSFRYSEDSPYILKNLSLKVCPGEYIAIVGKTGCGKSTLVRLLLGFEMPEKGAVYYDGRDLCTLDPGSLRKHIGTVTQDGGLFRGDIYSNIVITSPQLSVDAAWEAAEIAGIADDIRAMPMGMYTLISEGQGGISGGQRERLMIARAVAPKPKLLIFDEATAALDNKTQKQVSDALDAMGCTRIVVAHRLSTIKNADRIVVLEDGGIVEDGTYDELTALNGYFARLVEGQRLSEKD